MMDLSINRLVNATLSLLPPQIQQSTPAVVAIALTAIALVGAIFLKLYRIWASKNSAISNSKGPFYITERVVTGTPVEARQRMHATVEELQLKQGESAFVVHVGRTPKKGKSNNSEQDEDNLVVLNGHEDVREVFDEEEVTFIIGEEDSIDTPISELSGAATSPASPHTPLIGEARTYSAKGRLMEQVMLDVERRRSFECTARERKEDVNGQPVEVLHFATPFKCKQAMHQLLSQGKNVALLDETEGTPTKTTSFSVRLAKRQQVQKKPFNLGNE